jgi:hypothetical protein
MIVKIFYIYLLQHLKKDVDHYVHYLSGNTRDAKRRYWMETHEGIQSAYDRALEFQHKVSFCYYFIYFNFHLQVANASDDEFFAYNREWEIQKMNWNKDWFQDNAD